MCTVSLLSCQQTISANVTKHHELLQIKIQTLFDDMDANELAICYSAMKKLNVSNVKTLEAKIAEKYGFRF